MEGIDLLNPESSYQVVLLALGVLFFFFLLFAAFGIAVWWWKRYSAVSPYTEMPLRRATDLSYFSQERILRFLAAKHQYDNRIFRFRRAALCRETGRVFSDCVTWFDMIRLDWSFLQKRYPGNYVSWGSLTSDQKDAIRACHESLEGYQTDISCPEPSPRLIEPEYVFTKPGPLYVDVNTHVLLGWKIVPGTELEVLIVQKPKERIPTYMKSDE